MWNKLWPLQGNWTETHTDKNMNVFYMQTKSLRTLRPSAVLSPSTNTLELLVIDRVEPSLYESSNVVGFICTTTTENWWSVKHRLAWILTHFRGRNLILKDEINKTQLCLHVVISIWGIAGLDELFLETFFGFLQEMLWLVTGHLNVTVKTCHFLGAVKLISVKYCKQSVQPTGRCSTVEATRQTEERWRNDVSSLVY